MSSKTLVLGLEHFIDKIGYQAQVYSDNGINVKYLVRNKNGNSDYFSKKYNADVDILPENRFLIIIKTIWAFIKYKPGFVEIYDTGYMFFVYVIISFFFRKKIIVILRGGELQKCKGRKRNVYYLMHKIGVMLSWKYVIKERNIINEYIELGFNDKKYVEVHNSVPMPDSMIDTASKSIDLLYLNSVTKHRNVYFLSNVIHKILLEKPNLKVVMTGFNTLDNCSYSYDIEQESKTIEYIKENNLDGIIEIKGFVKNPRKYHSKAKIFLFPSSIVFLNYSLLESMSYGAVPIVSNGEGAEKIVNDENGYILPLDEDLWVRKIINLLDNPNLLESKSKNSILTIKEKFSMESWFKKMMEARGS